MLIVNWWNELSIAAQIFYCLAIPSTMILLVQTALMLIGFGNEADGVGDGDIDDIEDVDVSDVEDISGLDGLRIFTVRGIIAFFVVFGWVGVAMEASSISLFVTIPVAFICGLAMALFLALLFRAALLLRTNGNADNKNAIGISGKVHLTIPPSRTGEGKVHLMLQGAYVERNAVTDDEEAITTGCEVVVVGVSGQTDLIVKKK